MLQMMSALIYYCLISCCLLLPLHGVSSVWERPLFFGQDRCSENDFFPSLPKYPKQAVLSLELCLGKILPQQKWWERRWGWRGAEGGDKSALPQLRFLSLPPRLPSAEPPSTPASLPVVEFGVASGTGPVPDTAGKRGRKCGCG